MEYQKKKKIVTQYSRSAIKIQEKKWFEINDESRGNYKINDEIKFKTSILKPSLCDYSNAYILKSGTVTVPNIGVVMLIYSLIEYSNNYLITGSFWQYYRYESALNANGAITGFPADNNDSVRFKFKTKIAGRTGNYGTKDVKLMVPLKYLSKFRRILEMPLINCETNLILTWSANFLKERWSC